MSKQVQRSILIVILTVASIVGAAFAWSLFSSAYEPYRRRAVADELKTAADHLIIDQNNKKAIERIRSGAISGDTFERCYAMTRIGRLKSQATTFDEELIGGLRSGNPFVMREAARAVAAIGPGGDFAIDDLISKLSDRDNDVSIFAAEALGSIGPSAR